jgi:hypothetical protein
MTYASTGDYRGATLGHSMPRSKAARARAHLKGPVYGAGITSIRMVPDPKKWEFGYCSTNASIQRETNQFTQPASTMPHYYRVTTW